MAKWLEQASQWHKMHYHDLEVMSSNPGQVEVGVLGTSVLSRTWIKICSFSMLTITKTTFFLRCAGKLASGWITVAITVERFITVAFPMKVARISTPKIAKIIICSIFALCSALGSFPFWTIGLVARSNDVYIIILWLHRFWGWCVWNVEFDHTKHRFIVPSCCKHLHLYCTHPDLPGESHEAKISGTAAATRKLSQQDGAATHYHVNRCGCGFPGASSTLHHFLSNQQAQR